MGELVVWAIGLFTMFWIAAGSLWLTDYLEAQRWDRQSGELCHSPDQEGEKK